MRFSTILLSVVLTLVATSANEAIAGGRGSGSASASSSKSGPRVRPPTSFYRAYRRAADAAVRNYKRKPRKNNSRPRPSLQSEAGRTPLLSIAAVKMFSLREELQVQWDRRAFLAAKLRATLDWFAMPEPEPEPLRIDQAANQGDIDRLVHLIDNGADVDQPDVVGRTAMHWATVTGKTEAIKLLIESGADINIKDKMFGQSPLHYAAQHGKYDIVLELMNHGSTLDAPNAAGMTPVQVANKHGRKDIAEVLQKAVERQRWYARRR